VLVAPADPAAPGARRTALIVGVLAIAVFMSSLDLFIVNLAFPYIGREYQGTTLSALSWVLNGYTIVFAAVLVPAGRWATGLGGAGTPLWRCSPPLLLRAGARGRVPSRPGWYRRPRLRSGVRVAVPAAAAVPLTTGPRPSAGRRWPRWAPRSARDRRQPGPAELAVVFWINIPAGVAAIVRRPGIPRA
jgi:hypothetical protein